MSPAMPLKLSDERNVAALKGMKYSPPFVLHEEVGNGFWIYRITHRRKVLVMERQVLILR
jgi:hypothetical protein